MLSLYEWRFYKDFAADSLRTKTGNSFALTGKAIPLTAFGFASCNVQLQGLIAVPVRTWECSMLRKMTIAER